MSIPPVNRDELNNTKWRRAIGGAGIGQDAPPAEDPYTLDESELDGYQGRFVIPSGR